MFVPADCIPISALQHYLYCPRQCALIHLEQLWTENAYTAEGRILHEKAHSGAAETRGGLKTVTGLSLRSLALGLTGQADVVEFRRDAQAPHSLWRAFPVEYKRGRPKKHDADRVQLCAQALCLEEMLGSASDVHAGAAPHAGVPLFHGKHACAPEISEGALFYGKTRRRVDVMFDDALRDLTRRVATAVHELLRAGITPPPPPLKSVNDICPACSLIEECMPLPLARRRSAAHYLNEILVNI